MQSPCGGFKMTDNQKELFYCKDCDSDPFEKLQRCQNFEMTLEQFHTKQGHQVVLYIEKESSIIELFTQKMQESMPSSVDELKESLKITIEYDVDKERTVDSDADEFSKDNKGGFFAYEEKNSAQHFAKDFVSDIMLPAHVYNGKASCGAWKNIGCLEKDLHEYGGGYIRKGEMHCNYKGCRKCATNTIKREALAITNRMMTFCNLKRNRKIYLKENRSRILLHTIISIPYDEHSLYTTKKGRKKLRQKAIKYLKEFDIDGGVMIDHPYRFDKGLESARLSPHLHMIITGWIDGQKAKELYEKTGWILSNISTMESWNDCYNLAKYLLSHSAVFMKEDGKRSAEHSVRYFGECHNKKFKVEQVLKFSDTGKEQLDSVIFGRQEIEIKGKIFKLQKVAYTHSTIQEEIKDVTNEYFEEIISKGVFDFAKSLRRYITPEKDLPRDNPAITQSDQPSLEFLQMRFEYGLSQYSIVQSVYVNIIFDTNLDELCPECSLKMQTLAPPKDGWTDQQAETIADLLKEIPIDITIPVDNISEFDYLRNTGISILGLPYFDFDGKLQYDTGIYGRPDNLELLNPKLYWIIIKNIDSQSARYQFKIQNGRSPTQEELHDVIRISKSKSKNESGSLLNYF